MFVCVINVHYCKNDCWKIERPPFHEPPLKQNPPTPPEVRGRKIALGTAAPQIIKRLYRQVLRKKTWYFLYLKAVIACTNATEKYRGKTFREIRGFVLLNLNSCYLQITSWVSSTLCISGFFIWLLPSYSTT